MRSHWRRATDSPWAQVGSLVYARVSLAHKDMEPELQCYDAQTRKSEGFGELKGGFMQKCSLGTCRACVYAVSPSRHRGIHFMAGCWTRRTGFCLCSAHDTRWRSLWA